MNVHQVLSGAGARDAITTIALAFRQEIRSWGWGGQDVAGRIVPGCPGNFTGLDTLRAGPEDVLLIHHSAAIPQLDRLLEIPARKLLQYHNVTPARWLWEQSPLLAAHCEIGRAQLADIVPRVTVGAADSEFNAAELRALGATRTMVVSPVVDLGRLGPPPSAATTAAANGGGPTVLFVGRLSPHKRQERVIAAFSLFRRRHAPAARLVLVGEPISESHTAGLRQLADALAPGAVAIESGLSDRELGERYRGADVFLCLSAHEGFCIPLLEAMGMGLPVIASACGALPEVAGDAALLVEADEDVDVVAELLALVLGDPELRGELVRRGARRVEAYPRSATMAALRAAIEQTAASPAA